MIDNELELRVTKHLHFLGVPTNSIGFDYLRYAIVLVSQDATYKVNLTKRLYPDVGERFKTTTSRAERAMRHAIGVAFNRNDNEILRKYFGRYVTWNNGKATNGEFISTVADNIALGMEVE